METLFENEDAQVALLTPENDAEEIERVIQLFEEIAVEQSWQSGNQLRAYPENSVYFALYVNGDLAGALQLVQGNADEGLPCLTVWPELNLLGRADVADVALMALGKDYRGSRKLFWLLCTEMWRYCVRHNINELWIEATPKIIALERRLGWPLQISGDLRLHWGEYCHPCKMSVAEAQQGVGAKAEYSQNYKKIMEQGRR